MLTNGVFTIFLAGRVELKELLIIKWIMLTENIIKHFKILMYKVFLILWDG